jgi:hypothetical protein
MAEIDVTDVLFDADVAGDTFTVLRRIETVSQFGISSSRVTAIPNVVGSVQPTGDNSLIREDAYDAQAKTIKVFTSFRLRGVSADGSGTYKPDQIVWNGDVYEVKVLDDYTQFGGGMTEAECVQIAYNGPPPDQLLPRVGRLDFSQIANSGLGGGGAA